MAHKSGKSSYKAKPGHPGKMPMHKMDGHMMPGMKHPSGKKASGKKK